MSSNPYTTLSPGPLIPTDSNTISSLTTTLHVNKLISFMPFISMCTTETQTPGSGFSGTILTYDTTVADVGSVTLGHIIYDSGLFTVPADGMYRITANAAYIGESSDGGKELNIVRTGTIINGLTSNTVKCYLGPGGTSNNKFITTSAVLKCVSGDTLNILARWFSDTMDALNGTDANTGFVTIEMLPIF